MADVRLLERNPLKSSEGIPPDCGLDDVSGVKPDSWNQDLTVKQSLYFLEVQPFTRRSVRRYKAAALKEHNVSIDQKIFAFLFGLMKPAFVLCLATIVTTVPIGVAYFTIELFELSNPALNILSELLAISCKIAGLAFLVTMSGPILGFALVIGECALSRVGYKDELWRNFYLWHRTSTMKNLPSQARELHSKIARLCPDAEFYVEYMANDPFLLVRQGRFGRVYYVAVWDEGDFLG